MTQNGKATSRNLAERLRPKPANYEPCQRPYVANVRVQVDRCKNSGSQQHRLRYGDECWLISQDRWITEHRAAGESWDKIIAVLQACVDEAKAARDNEDVLAEITPDAFIEAVKVERAAGFHEDSATDEALHYRSPGYYRRVADYARAQAEALDRKARRAIALSLKLETASR
jgi:hypothetical protein